MRERRRWLVAGLAAMLLLGAACSAEGEGEVDLGDDAETTSPAGEDTQSPDDGIGVGVGIDLGVEGLVARDNEFDPADFTIASGASFELNNGGETEHNFTLADADLDEDVDAGESTTITIDLEPGTYDYVCEYHEADGMTGTVTVE